MEDPSGPAATAGGGRSAERRRRLVPALIGFGVAAIVGGVIGGLIVVRATWGPADGGGNDQLSWGASLGLVVLYGLIAAGVALVVFRTRDIVA